jgi:23S rRNA (uracil1939-C5)-methyltransferase
MTAPSELQQRFQKGQVIEVEITDAAEAEKCFGRLTDGVAVFVQGMVAVGDTVEAKVYKIKKKFLEARMVRVLKPSPARVQATCSHFGVCGGCKWQHVDYPEQLRLKRKILEDALAHLGAFDRVTVHPVLPAPLPFGYRNKVDFSFSDKRFLLPEEVDLPATELRKPANFALGFHAPQRYAKAIDIDYCFISTPEMNEVLALVRAFFLARGTSVYNPKTHLGFLRNLVVRQSEANGEVMVNLVTSRYDEALMKDLALHVKKALGTKLGTVVCNITQRQNQVAFGDEEVVVDGPGVLTEKLADFTYSISANSFFQTNTQQALTLYEKILELSALTGTERVYDLYCGTGSISLFLARSCKEVLGVEVIESALRDAEANAERNGIENVTFQALDMRNLKKSLDSFRAWGEPDVIVTDPPRAGMHPKAVEALRELAPQRIVYVSCKPASLARDARALCEGGAYRLEGVHPVDMFPHTTHIEAVAVLQRV